MEGPPNPAQSKPLSGASIGTALGKLAGSFKKGRGGRRFFQGLSAATRSFTQTLRRVGKILWLEVTGFLFFWLALIGGVACWREYNAYAAGKAAVGRTVVAALFTVLFAYFAINSFWKARRS